MTRDRGMGFLFITTRTRKQGGGGKTESKRRYSMRALVLLFALGFLISGCWSWSGQNMGRASARSRERRNNSEARMERREILDNQRRSRSDRDSQRIQDNLNSDPIDLRSSW